MRCLLLAGAMVPAIAGASWSQTRPVSRAEAVAAAVAQGPRLALARSDSNAAVAGVARARQWENPILSLEYTKDAPRQHYALGIPLPFPSRGTRIDIATWALASASQRLAFEREAVAYDADTSYTQALVAEARARLSTRAARFGDSLLTLATVRREAGDASDLDVELARVNAGQLANTAVVDSMEAANALLGVQIVMGLPTETPAITLTDTLDLPAIGAAPAPGTTLLIAAAESDVQATERTMALQRRWVFTQPALTVGFETDDPGGRGHQLLPTFGLLFPLPVFNQNGPALQAAIAEHGRATASLALVRIELGAARARAERALVVARVRVARSQQLAVSARRVAALSLLAYQEGAAALPMVLESQRTSLETLFQVVDDIAAVRNSAGLVRLLSVTVTPPPP